MGFHELATNAIKYGALSSEAGRIDVTWRIDDGPDTSILDIEWRESGGPPVATPQRRGFGTRMIERGLAHELDGSCEISFDPGGVACHLRLPLTGKLRRAASNRPSDPSVDRGAPGEGAERLRQRVRRKRAWPARKRLDSGRQHRSGRSR